MVKTVEPYYPTPTASHCVFNQLTHLKTYDASPVKVGGGIRSMEYLMHDAERKIFGVRNLGFKHLFTPF